VALLALTTSQVGKDVIVGIAVWLVICGGAAVYGHGKGYPLFPLFLGAVLLGPFGPGAVLLLVAIGAGRFEDPP
jgi:hypothetical protein